MKAVRSDNKNTYTVVKITDWGIWLLLDQPNNIASATIQIIERANSASSGKWIDTIMPVTGQISSISGGRCWE